VSRDEEITEVLWDLRCLAQAPSIEAAQTVLQSWEDRKDMYDHTASAWRLQSPQEGL
jgi:hypothetical protein